MVLQLDGIGAGGVLPEEALFQLDLLRIDQLGLRLLHPFLDHLFFLRLEIIVE